MTPFVLVLLSVLLDFRTVAKLVAAVYVAVSAAAGAGYCATHHCW